ncbi:hypothetical protein [Pseudomonas sp. RA_35y_Pfl2_P32]|uniref:hypothetical protein n=1 Tax=Pseudomonas sp. RA_35y_Pfl2_P32 TaxID=3088705 RepID=UPI0030DBEA1E
MNTASLKIIASKTTNSGLDDIKIAYAEGNRLDVQTGDDVTFINKAGEVTLEGRVVGRAVSIHYEEKPAVVTGPVLYVEESNK